MICFRILHQKNRQKRKMKMIIELTKALKNKKKNSKRP